MTIAVRPNFQNLDRDPYWSMRSLGLHFDGANGSTTITDNSPTPKTASVNGNAQISTGTSRFGQALHCDGNGDYVVYNTNAAFDFGLGDFTISFFYYKADSTDAMFIAHSLTGTASTISYRAYHIGGNIGFHVYSGSTAYQITSPEGSTSTWHHFEACRQAGTLYLFLDGHLVGSTAANVSMNAASGRFFRIGIDAGSSRPLNGYMDDVLVYKGVALHTADFRPPQRPFANR